MPCTLLPNKDPFNAGCAQFTRRNGAAATGVSQQSIAQACTGAAVSFHVQYPVKSQSNRRRERNASRKNKVQAPHRIKRGLISLAYGGSNTKT